MGGFMSRPERSAKEHSDEIECKILIFGSSGSGRTTIIKQMMILHGDGFPSDESSMFVAAIHRNVFNSAYQLVEYMKKTSLKCADDSNRLLAERIYRHVLPTPASDDVPILAPEVAQAIHKLWMDPIIRKVMNERRSEIALMESVSYFFDEVLRIGAQGYIPNETDVLRARAKEGGIKEIRIRMGSLSLNLVDVSGQRTERMKWIHCFESVPYIMYCVGLDHYNQVLSADNTQNRMNESLLLFDSVVNSRWFLRTRIILLMNKADIFKASLKTDPLDHYFAEYTGGDDVNKAAKYILWKFMQVNRARLPVYPHLVQATDLSNMRLVFAVVKETILQTSLRDAGIV